MQLKVLDLLHIFCVLLHCYVNDITCNLELNYFVDFFLNIKSIFQRIYQIVVELEIKIES
jgi:hypothetical protein